MEEQTVTINLKILSPSNEVEGGVNFTDIPATTTVRELRLRIQDAISTKPALERMRLIYRGRVVANDADTLDSVFGTENIRQSKDQSLHLVVRELPPSSDTSASPAPRASTAPPNPFRPAQAATPVSPPLQTNPFRTLPQPRPSSQPQVAPQHAQHLHHHHPHGLHQHHHHHPGPHNGFPVALPPAFQQQLMHTMAQQGQPHNGQTPPPQGQTPGEGTPLNTSGQPPPPTGLPQLPGFGQANFPPNANRTVRQEGVGPNGERWSVTYSSTNIPGQPQQPVLSRPVPPSIPPRPSHLPSADRLIAQLREIINNARQEMENARTLLRASSQQAQSDAPPSTTPPVWRFERIRQQTQTMARGLDTVDLGLETIAHVGMAENPDVTTLRQSATELRRQLAELNQLMSQHMTSAPSETPALQTVPVDAEPGPSTSTSHPAPSTTQAQATPTLPSSAPEELFILSSPQGPVGILFNHQGTYATAPMNATLPFQTFTNQFAQNRQIIAGLGQHIAHGSGQVHNFQPTPTPTQPANNGGAAQPQAQQDNANANPPADPQENDRIGNIAGHLWLVVKLACFVYFFSGGGGIYKTLILGFIAAVVYIAQLGMFEEQFNLVRRHFEAILPIGALAERAAQPRNANPNANNQAQHQQPGQDRTNTPEELARRLMQDRQNQRFSWLRETARTVERSVAIFVASLWPGIGERMVHAQEERVRLERVAEEERARAEEEARAREEEEKRAEEERKADGHGEGEGSGEPASSGKGKERAHVADAETEQYAAASSADP